MTTKSKDINTTALIDFLTQRIPVVPFFQSYFPNWSGNFTQKVLCPFHQDTSPSMKLNENGSFHCFGCEHGSGGGVVKFYALIEMKATIWEACEELWLRHIGKMVPRSVVELQVQALRVDKETQERLTTDRGWNWENLWKHDIGWTKSGGGRIAAPYYNVFGVCEATYYYDYLHQEELKDRKVTPHHGGFPGTGHLWPRSQIGHREGLVILCEGVADAIYLLSHGIRAVTAGSANNPIKGSDLDLLAGMEVAVIYDRDAVGDSASLKVAKQVAGHGKAAGVRLVQLPFVKKDHKDITEWMHIEKNKPEALFQLIGGTPYFKLSTPDHITLKNFVLGGNGSGGNGRGSPPPPPSSDPSVEADYIPLQDVFKSSNYQKPWRTDAVVIGKNPTYLYAPRTLKVTCKKHSQKCISSGDCRFCTSEDWTIRVRLEPSDPVILQYIECANRKMALITKDQMGLSPKCVITVDTEDTYTLSRLLLGPTMAYQESGLESMEAIQLFAYYFGTNIRTNIPYIFTGYSTQHPIDGSVVALVTDAKSTATTLDNFRVTEEVMEQFTPFRPKEGVKIYDHLLEHYDHCARSITGILERPLVHMGIDLVFHSPVSFSFGGDLLRKASLDVLAYGDTRTGKNFITDNLRAYYQHGESISGECVSAMNLIGGIKMVDHFRGLAWGRLVMRNRDTVIINEMSAMQREMIGLMTSIRSEGIAKVDKDSIHQEAQANVGLIWLANPRDTRMMGEYMYGLEGILTLVGDPADIARFDYVLALASGDVSAEAINKETVREEHRYTQEQCHNLILWIKSRSAEQIQFTDEATAYIYRKAIDFSKVFIDSIPLVQGENFRFKIAKVAAAIAGRIYSSNETGDVLVVTKGIAMAAVQFLWDVLTMPALGYKMYSDLKRKYLQVDTETLVRDLREVAHAMDLNMRDFCAKFGQIEQFNIEDIRMMINLTQEQAYVVRNLLARHNCIVRHGKYFEKSKGFNRFLKEALDSKDGIEVLGE